MPVDKPTISMDAELRAEADRLADAEGVSFSAFVSSAVRDAVQRRRASKGLLFVVAGWEREHGALDDEEVRAAAAELGLEIKPAKKKVRVSSAAGRSIGSPAVTGRFVAKSKAAKKSTSTRKR
jgi:predicted transcriptional regulator